MLSGCMAWRLRVTGLIADAGIRLRLSGRVPRRLHWPMDRMGVRDFRGAGRLPGALLCGGLLRFQFLLPGRFFLLALGFDENGGFGCLVCLGILERIGFVACPPPFGLDSLLNALARLFPCLGAGGGKVAVLGPMQICPRVQSRDVFRRLCWIDKAFAVSHVPPSSGD